MEENQALPQRTFLRAVVYFKNAISPIECVVREISDTGARLELPNPQPRNGAVELYIPINGKKFKATVEWQSNDQIGLAFEPLPPGRAPDKDATPKGTDPNKNLNNTKYTSISVLVVDDSRTTTRVILDFLKNLGFVDIDDVHDGQTALNHLSSKKYGLILSDWEMAPMSGEEFLKNKRLNPRNANTPVILITASAGRGASWLAGATAYVSKPFGENELHTAITRAFFLNS